MTEEEARKKWCPMYQVSGANGFNNRDDGKNCLCIASECMMWVGDKGDAKVNGRWMADQILDTGHCGLIK